MGEWEEDDPVTIPGQYCGDEVDVYRDSTRSVDKTVDGLTYQIVLTFRCYEAN